jgi:hypothetical protein
MLIEIESGFHRYAAFLDSFLQGIFNGLGWFTTGKGKVIGLFKKIPCRYESMLCGTSPFPIAEEVKNSHVCLSRGLFAGRGKGNAIGLCIFFSAYFHNPLKISFAFLQEQGTPCVCFEEEQPVRNGHTVSDRCINLGEIV